MRLRIDWRLGVIFWLLVLCIGLASSFPSPPVACVMNNNESKIYYKVNPKKIVIEPWRGQHNVYALFVVPQKYAATLGEREAIVRINGVESTVNATVAKPSLYKQVEVPEDSLLLISYLWTRDALWQILQGKYGELQQFCNWTLYIRL